MKWGVSVGRRLKILRNVHASTARWDETVGIKWSVECLANKSECRCRATSILGWMSVSDEENCLVAGVGITSSMGPITLKVIWHTQHGLGTSLFITKIVLFFAATWAQSQCHNMVSNFVAGMTQEKILFKMTIHVHHIQNSNNSSIVIIVSQAWQHY